MAQTTTAPAATPLTPHRIVFLGDSITDGHTYPSLIAQALSEAGKPVPIMTNAGIGGDTAKGMNARFDRDVLFYKPDIMTLSAGANDVVHGVEPAAYAADIEQILDKADKAGIQVIVMTTCVMGEKNADKNPKLEVYDAALLAAAQKRHLRVAQVTQLMQQALKDGQTFLETDDVHPNFAGQRIIARAVLDAMGYSEVPVPQKMKLSVMPGVIAAWKIRPVDEKTQKPLDETTVLAVKPDATWKDYSLPEAVENPNHWLDQERRRGFALSLDTLIGRSRGYIGVATVPADRDKTVYFNTGAQLQALWVNGKKYYRQAEWCGWHAGRQRIAVPLHAGDNTVVVETGTQFFLSVTDTNMW